MGASILIDWRAVIEAGGFDELFFHYFEDRESSMRMRARGHRIAREPSALVFDERADGTPDLSYRGNEIKARRSRMRRFRRLADRNLLVGGLPPLAPGLLHARTEKVLLA